MFVTKKMVLLDILVLQKDIEAVSKLMVKSGYYEPSIHSAVSVNTEVRWAHENITDKKKILSTLSQHAKELYSFFEHYNTTPIINKNTEMQTIPAIGDSLRQYKLKKEQFENRIYQFKKQKEEIAVKITGLRMYLDTQQKHQDVLKHSKNLYSMLGLISSTNLNILENEFSRFGGELLTEGHVNDSEIVFIAIPKEKQTELKTLLDQLYFIDYGLPDEFFGEGTANMMKLGFEYTIVCDQEELLEFEIKKLSPIILANLQLMLDSLQKYTKISEIQQSSKRSGHFVLLSGWITMKTFRTFKEELEQICEKNYELTVTDADNITIQTDIPTELSNPAILSPFQQLVTIFGIPNYKEIDPTPFFAFLYVFMYGAMFGDVGQGALLLFIGILGKIFKRHTSFNIIFGLLIWVGIFAIMFGFLYGSYFGYESVYYDWVPEPLWMSPMHNIDEILLYAVMFGIGVISCSYILGIINSIRMKEWGTLIFSHKGLTAFIVYLIVLSMGYGFIQGKELNLISLSFLIILSLFLGLERVWEALIYGHGSIKDWWMGIFDMFEFYLSMLTNTLSFVRIGAFALTHAALMMAVFTLRDLAGGNTIAAYLIVVLGNIFVIGMEGFIVGIQTLRLEYYEFFMRFFRGTGRVFTPISYKS